jgi:hypothetical protein
MAVLIAGLAVSLTAAQGTNPSQAPDAIAAIRTLEQRIEEAFLKNEVGFLNEVLRDDFVFNVAGGGTVGKDDAIARFAAPGRSTARRLTAVQVDHRAGVDERTC